MKSLRHVWFIAVKDLKLFVTDRMALGAFILFPFLFVALVSFVMGGMGSEDKRMELHIVTQEDSDGLSHQIARAIETEDEAELPDSPDPAHLAEKSILLKDVKEAMQHLTQDQRDVITLRFFSGLSSRETAAVLEKSDGSVREMQRAALEKLRQLLN